MNADDNDNSQDELRDVISQAYDKANAEGDREVTQDEVQARPEDELRNAGNKNQKEAEHAEKFNDPKPSVDEIKPHPRWDSATKEAFSKYPRDVQEFVLKREADVEKHLTSVTQKYSALDQLLEPHRQEWATNGLDDVSAIKQLVTLSQFADRDPVGFAQWFMQQKGITSPVNAGEVAPDNDYIDPQLAQLVSRLERIEQQNQQISQDRLQQTQRNVAEQLTAFKSAVDDKGAPKHPYYNDPRVQKEMAFRLNQGVADSFEQAYEQAIGAVPEIREALFKEQLEALRNKQMEEAKAAANKAARVSGTNIARKSTPNGQMDRGKRSNSWDDITVTINDAAAAIYGAN